MINFQHILRQNMKLVIHLKHVLMSSKVTKMQENNFGSVLKFVGDYHFCNRFLLVLG